MKIEIIEVKDQQTCHPVTIGRVYKECLIANVSFKEITQNALNSYIKKLDYPSKSDKLTFFIYENVCIFELLSNLDSLGSMAFYSDKNELLAYISESLEAIPTNKVILKDFMSIKYPWDLLEANEKYLNIISSLGLLLSKDSVAIVDGFLGVGEGTKILPGVYIEGNVLIGENCKIGPNCYLRGNTSIGDNCHIGQAVEIKNSLIMNNTSIGHLSYVGDSIICEHVNFGAGTITANFRHDGGNHSSFVDGKLVDTKRRKFGVIVGDNVHTGIHTSFYPGRKVWPKKHTLPGNVVKKDIF